MEKIAILAKEDLKQAIYEVINKSESDIVIVQAVISEIYYNVNDMYNQLLNQARMKTLAQAEKGDKTDSDVAATKE